MGNIGWSKGLSSTRKITSIPDIDRDAILNRLVGENDSDSIEYFYQESESELTGYFEIIDGLDSKTGILVGFSGALLAILAAASFKQAALLSRILGVIAIVFFVLAIGLALLALKPRELKRTPGLASLLVNYPGGNLNYIKKNIIFYRTVHFHEYQELMLKKRSYMVFSFLSIFAGAVFLAFGVGWRIIQAKS